MLACCPWKPPQNTRIELRKRRNMGLSELGENYWYFWEKQQGNEGLRFSLSGVLQSRYSEKRIGRIKIGYM